MIESFLQYITFEKRFSSHTVTSYRNDLLQFHTFLSENFPDLTIDKASSVCVRSWIIHLMDLQLNSRSVNRKLASLRAFYKFLHKQGLCNDDQMQKLNALKARKNLPVFVQEDHLSRLLDDFPFEDNFSGLRDKLILELLYATGIRLSELIGLKENDVNLFSREIKVLGKRNKERIIPFPKSIGLIIEKYNGLKFKQFPDNRHGCLIVTNKGEPSYPMFIYRVVKKYLDLIPSVEKKSPHVLRHTFATHLLDKGADLNAIKELLGHASLAATQVYTHNSLEKLKAIFDQAHPKA